MKKYVIFSAVIASLFVGISCYAENEILVGGDKDEHGCKGSAGYSWDETYQACLRPWEVKSGVYASSQDFLAAQGKSCKVASDGCNTVHISNGQAGAMTEMYCEDIYGDFGSEKWSCLDEKLEEQELGFLGESNKKYYIHLRDTTLGVKISEKINALLDTQTTKILESTQYDISKSQKQVESVIQKLTQAQEKISKKYPADAKMNKTDTFSYNVLQYARFQLQIIENRWKVNSGIEDISSTAKDSQGNILEMNFHTNNQSVTLTYNNTVLGELSAQRAASGIWYKNDTYELRGKGEEIELSKNGKVMFQNY